jgi:hypothetical protein
MVKVAWKKSAPGCLYAKVGRTLWTPRKHDDLRMDGEIYLNQGYCRVVLRTHCICLATVE